MANGHPGYQGPSQQGCTYNNGHPGYQGPNQQGCTYNNGHLPHAHAPGYQQQWQGQRSLAPQQFHTGHHRVPPALRAYRTHRALPRSLTFLDDTSPAADHSSVWADEVKPYPPTQTGDFSMPPMDGETRRLPEPLSRTGGKSGLASPFMYAAEGGFAEVTLVSGAAPSGSSSASPDGGARLHGGEPVDRASSTSPGGRRRKTRAK